MILVLLLFSLKSPNTVIPIQRCVLYAVHPSIITSLNRAPVAEVYTTMQPSLFSPSLVPATSWAAQFVILIKLRSELATEFKTHIPNGEPPTVSMLLIIQYC